GGGNHITLGGPKPQKSPWLGNPRLLASFITFLQHHPSISYLFTGLFVGPTSQAPRLDEARHDALYEMEIALTRAFEHDPGAGPPPPWLADALLPTWLWQDFEDVLAFLDSRGLPHPAEVYRAFLELRCPLAGQLQAGDVLLEVRNALEPWNVLGEEPTAGGTSRYVDSSVERIE